MSPTFRAATAVLLLALASCGGGAGSSTTTPAKPLPTGANVAPLLVDAGPTATNVNLPSVTVTICVPGTTTCQTIDHVLVDTGSTGLRILASVLNTTMYSGLQPVTTAASDPVFECLGFASNAYSWGSVRTADLQLANGRASSLAIQLIGNPADPNAPAIPAAPTDSATGCLGSPQNTADMLGGNGLIGINVFLQDCGSYCGTTAANGYYYACPNTGCVGTTMLPDVQIHNPVSEFATDNNGVEIVLPAITAVGASTVTGALVLGIDTQSNNQLGAATVLSVDPVFGNFTTVYKGQSYTNLAFIDSGSNGYFFPDSTLQVCTNKVWFCPATAVTLTAMNQGGGTSSGNSTVNFNIANADSLFNTHPFSAYENIGGPIGFSGFDWGLPFFFGRTVAVAFEGKTTSAGAGPFVAYANF